MNQLQNLIQEGTIIQASTQDHPYRHFKLTKQAGQGSQGQVYFAEAIGNFNSKEVAIKLSHKQQVEQKEQDFLINLMKYQNSQFEINAPSNIIKILDFFEYYEYFVTVMEKGEMDLSHYIQQNKASLTMQEKIKICLEVTLPIHFLHQKQIFYRDVKPENYLKIGNKFKLIDFGQIVKYDKDREMTIGVGTPIFSAPEITKYQTNYTPKVDIWSLACLFYELCNDGQALFNNTNGQQFQQNYFEKSKTEIIDKIQNMNCDVEMKQLLINMLELDANKRCDSQAVIQSLQQIELKYQQQQQQQQQPKQQSAWQQQISKNQLASKNVNQPQSQIYQNQWQKPSEVSFKQTPVQTQNFNENLKLQFAKNQQFGFSQQQLTQQIQSNDELKQNQYFNQFTTEKIDEIVGKLKFVIEQKLMEEQKKQIQEEIQQQLNVRIQYFEQQNKEFNKQLQKEEQQQTQNYLQKQLQCNCINQIKQDFDNLENQIISKVQNDQNNKILQLKEEIQRQIDNLNAGIKNKQDTKEEIENLEQLTGLILLNENNYLAQVIEEVQTEQKSSFKISDYLYKQQIGESLNNQASLNLDMQRFQTDQQISEQHLIQQLKIQNAEFPQQLNENISIKLQETQSGIKNLSQQVIQFQQFTQQQYQQIQYEIQQWQIYIKNDIQQNQAKFENLTNALNEKFILQQQNQYKQQTYQEYDTQGANNIIIRTQIGSQGNKQQQERMYDQNQIHQLNQNEILQSQNLSHSQQTQPQLGINFNYQQISQYIQWLYQVSCQFNTQIQDIYGKIQDIYGKIQNIKQINENQLTKMEQIQMSIQHFPESNLNEINLNLKEHQQQMSEIEQKILNINQILTMFEQNKHDQIKLAKIQEIISNQVEENDSTKQLQILKYQKKKDFQLNSQIINDKINLTGKGIYQLDLNQQQTI